MIQGRFSPQARRDLDEICAFINAANPDAARKVRRTILDTADLLARSPEIGRSIRNASGAHQETRWFVVPGFRNYLIFYRPYEDSVMVIRVLNAARDWTQFFPL
jgi:toxin ParE1/3/4